MKWILPLIVLLFVGLAHGAEKPKFTGESIEPRPETVPLPMPLESTTDQSGNAATGIDPPVGIDARHAPADPSEDLPPVPKRPLVYLYTSTGCTAGDQMRAANARGEFVGLDIEEKPAPDWYTLCPTFHWRSASGSWVKYPRDATDYRGVSGMLAAFDRANPGERFKAVASRGAGELLAGSPMFEQIIKYLPDGTRITIEPPRPMKVMLEDRTSLSYSKITGRLATANGKSRLTLDQPKPIVEAWKGVRWLNLGTTFGAQFDFFEFEDTTPPSVGVGTNRGLYRFVMEPQK